MGFRRAVNHFPGSRVLLPILKRLRFPSSRSDGKLGEGGGGQVLETFSGGIPNHIPLKSDPGREVDVVQLTSGPCFSVLVPEQTAALRIPGPLTVAIHTGNAFSCLSRKEGGRHHALACTALRCSQAAPCSLGMCVHSGICTRNLFWS